MDFELEITALSRSGAGLGRDGSGRVVFVPFTAPGDRVRVRLVSEEKRYAEATLIEVLKPSPERVVPPCPVFGTCGGCEWQHLPYELQWQTKRGGVAHALERVKVSTEGLALEEIPAERIWEYRNRIQLRGYKEALGFYARRSRQIVPIEKCYIARPELNTRLEAVKAEGAGRPREYKVELEVFPDGKVTESWNASHSAQGFRQVHDDQNEKLQSWVRAKLAGGPMLLDLYGGRGNLSLGLAEKYAEIHCVDIGSHAANPPGTPAGFHFHQTSVLKWLQQNAKQLSQAPMIDAILDPPREGLGIDLAAIVEIFKGLPLRRLLMVGCDADSWARAVARLDSY
ncbi:MAG: class I SAM-dependent RNA methyltransferase, partial [Proteobacteria bacterium]